MKTKSANSDESTTRIPSPNVFDYGDFREFLADRVTYQKQGRRSFSYRRFSRDAGLGSPNYLKLVIDGKRNLSSSMAERFADGFRLASEAKKFFVALVAFNQATERDEISQARAHLMSFRDYRKTQRLESHQFFYFSHWYVPAIREMVLRDDFENDPAWISKQMRPSVSERNVKAAIHTLLELGLVEEKGSTLRPVTDLVTSGLEAPSDLLAKYHLQMMKLGGEAIARFPRKDRDITNVTVALGPDGLARLKQRVQEFRRDILELSTKEEERTQVVQLNFQLFPLTTNGGEL